MTPRPSHRYQPFVLSCMDDIPQLGRLSEARRLAMRALVAHLRLDLARGKGGDGFVGPNLAVGMRIAAAHGRALVLEDLHVPDTSGVCQAVHLVGPRLDDGPDRPGVHLRQREVVPRREAHDPTAARLGLCDEQLVARRRRSGRAGQQRREVVVERERGGIRGVPRAACARSRHEHSPSEWELSIHVFG